MRVWLMSTCMFLGPPSAAITWISPRAPSRGDSAVEPALDAFKRKPCGQAHLLGDCVQVDAMFAHSCVPMRTREMRSARDRSQARARARACVFQGLLNARSLWALPSVYPVSLDRRVERLC